MKRPITHESLAHENAAGERLRSLAAEIAAEFKRPMGVAIFVVDFGESGYLGWASNCHREDMATSLVEFLGTQEPAILQQAVARWTALGLLGPGAERTQ